MITKLSDKHTLGNTEQSRLISNCLSCHSYIDWLVVGMPLEIGIAPYARDSAEESNVRGEQNRKGD